MPTLAITIMTMACLIVADVPATMAGQGTALSAAGCVGVVAGLVLLIARLVATLRWSADPRPGGDATMTIETFNGRQGRAFSPPPVQEARFWTGKRKRLYALITGAGLIYAASASLSEWRDTHTILINTTASLPNWAFILDKSHAPVRGALIFFDPPSSPLVTAHFGAHPAAFGKRVYGVQGDVVTRMGRIFFVNGREVAVAKPVSSRGEPLAIGPTGIIPRGCYFVGTGHKDGFDSRYAAIGWVCMNRVFGTGTAIL